LRNILGSEVTEHVKNDILTGEAKFLIEEEEK
jgi:hypothetical protein